MGKNFKLPALCAAVLLGFIQNGNAQDEHLELSSRYDNNRNAVIEVQYHDGGVYSVVLEFYELSNFMVEKFRRAKVISKSQIAVLKPENPEESTSFRYKYRYIWGAVNPKKVDPAFVYRLPFGVSANREARELHDVYERYWIKGSRSVDFKSFQFMMNRADTVYAARKGVVVRVVDRHDPIGGMGEVSMNSENNQVLVEHADGTIARYGVLERGSIAVRPGDTVWPGTRIALAGTLDGKLYQMRFDVYFQTDNLGEIRNLDDYSIIYHFLDPLFVTSAGQTTLTHGGSYTPVTSEELVTKEMTKREIKKLGL